MELLETYVERLLKKDAEGIRELFGETARYDDYTKTGVFMTETHLIGSVAVYMYFCNRFIFRTYDPLEGKVIDDNHAELTIREGEKGKKINIVLADAKDGKIEKLILTPAEA